MLRVRLKCGLPMLICLVEVSSSTGFLGPDGDFVLHHQVWIFMQLRQGYVHLQWYYDLGETVVSVIIAVLVCFFSIC
jgi:hypothetical protein